MSLSPQVFLSYAREDIKTVKMIYNGLKKRKVNIWMDQEDINPGKWKTQIERAISQSRYFIICISEFALKKTGKKPGFQDEELNRAYNIAENLSTNEFTIIPIRLENCGRGDHRLSVFQQYDLFNDFDKELDKLALHIGGVSLSDGNAKDSRSKEDIFIDSLASNALAAYYARDFKKAIDLVKAALSEKPEYRDINNLMKIAKAEQKKLGLNTKGMSKTELVKEIAKAAEISQKDAAAALNSLLDSIAKSVKQKEGKVTLAGFGTFINVHRNPRKGRNPITGELIKIKAANIVKFKPSKKLRDLK